MDTDFYRDITREIEKARDVLDNVTSSMHKLKRVQRSLTETFNKYENLLDSLYMEGEVHPTEFVTTLHRLLGELERVRKEVDIRYEAVRLAKGVKKDLAQNVRVLDNDIERLERLAERNATFVNELEHARERRNVYMKQLKEYDLEYQIRIQEEELKLNLH